MNFKPTFSLKKPLNNLNSKILDSRPASEQSQLVFQPCSLSTDIVYKEHHSIFLKILETYPNASNDTFAFKEVHLIMLAQKTARFKILVHRLKTSV